MRFFRGPASQQHSGLFLGILCSDKGIMNYNNQGVMKQMHVWAFPFDSETQYEAKINIFGE